MTLQASNTRLLTYIQKSPHYDIGDDERVLLFIHKHWIVESGFFLSLFFIFTLLGSTFVFWDSLLAGYEMVVLLFVLLLIHLILIHSFWKWLDFYLDVIVVTDKRIIDINQEGLFHRRVKEISLMKIQNISSNIEGFFPQLFHYGDITMAVAGDTEDMGLTTIAYPEKIASEIRRIQEEYLVAHSTTATDA